MKADIHPNYTVCEVTCACGNKFRTRSTKSQIKVDICSACHPFFTGSQKFVDTAGRVDKFRRRYSIKSETEGEAGTETPAEAVTSETETKSEPEAT